MPKLIDGDLVDDSYDCDEHVDLKAPRLSESPDRNPLHPESLTLADITPGLKIVSVHTRTNYSTTLEIIEAPRKDESRGRDVYRVRIHRQSPIDDEITEEDRYLSDLGITPYPHKDDPWWNAGNYCIRA